MKKAVLILLALGTFLVYQVVASAAQATFVFPAQQLVFPNGNMAYFQKVNDQYQKIDFSGYENGVYNNWSPRKLLYTVEYSPADAMNGKCYFFSSTGLNHIEIYRMSGEMAFFEYGKQIKTDHVANYVKDKNTLTPYMSSNSGIMAVERFEYDYVNEALHVVTVDNQYLSFDIFTGSLLRQSYEDPFKALQVGSKVVITGDYYLQNKRIPTWVKCRPYTVQAIFNDCALLGDGLNSWVPLDSVISYAKLR